MALGIALALGLRHASDPDHLVAVTSLVAADNGGPRDATRLGVWWGLGHAVTLVLIGFPLIAFKSSLPAWLENGAEKAVGVVIVLLALRVIWKWAGGQYRVGRHAHAVRPATCRQRSSPASASQSRVEASPSQGAHASAGVRNRPLAWARGNGRRRGLMLAALPTRLEAGLGLALFAPMTIVSMAACTTAFAWVLTRPLSSRSIEAS